MMDSFAHKNNGIIKEEGELTDDEDNDKREEHFVTNSGSSFLSKEVSRHSSDQYKSLESRGKSGPKRKDYRRRAEADSRRSSRATADSGLKKHHRDHQDFRQASTLDSYTPSKFWANRKFRASSVRPLSPRHGKPSGPRRTDSPQSQKYRGSHDSTADCEDELERLEREQRRIREQLKSLEEEEENDGNNENGGSNHCVLESLDARSEAEDLATPFPGTSNSAALNYILENEKSDDEDIDLQELRRLALATSERHNRLMAIEPQTSQPGIPQCDIVVIPDVEPELPEPEVVLVDEEEDLSKDENSRQPHAAPIVGSSLTVSSPAKKKSKKSSKLKRKGESNSNKSGLHDEDRAAVKSKVTLPSRKKSRTKRHKKGETKQVDAWIRQREELRILVMDDPTRALQKLLKFASEWEGKEKPIVTGTIKDFKRQKQIPVLSDKRAVQNFAQHSVEKKKTIQEKRKELNEQDKKSGQLQDKKSGQLQDKKSGQLQDNYEEVEMDIDSNAGDEEDSSNFGGLHFGDDFNRAMLPVSSCPPGNYQQSLQPALPTSVPPPALPTSVPPPSLPVQPFLISPPLPFDAALPPPIPPPIPLHPPPPIPLQPPPPLPSHPPAYEQDSSWKNQHVLLEERIADILDNSLIANKYVNHTYPEDVSSLYLHREDNCQDVHNASFLEINLPEDKGTVSSPIGANSSAYPPDVSLDDAISKWLRMIRQNQEIPPECHALNVPRVIPVVPEIGSPGGSEKLSLHDSVPFGDNSENVNLHNSIPLAGDEVKTTNFETEYPKNLAAGSYFSVPPKKPDRALAFESDLYSIPGETLSPADKRYHSDIFSGRDFPSEKDIYRDKSDVYNNSPATKGACYRPSHNPARRSLNDRSPSPSRRIFLRNNCSRDGPDSPHSPSYSRRPPLSGGPKHRNEAYSPSQRLAPSRDGFRDHYNERSTSSSQHRSRNLPYEHYHHTPSSSPQQQTRHRRSHSSEGADTYQPEAPPRKKARPSSPPVYIPTAIRTINPSLVPQYDPEPVSDSEEEDPIALRNKLLAEVIEKRKFTAEGLSNNAAPSAVSSRQDSTHFGSLETFSDTDQPDECRPTLEAASVNLGVSQLEDEEEDVQPPPVISRVSRRLSKPPTLMELCKRQLATSGEQLRPRPEQHNLQQSVLSNLGSNLKAVEMFVEEDNDDLSKSDLATLRAYVVKAQSHTTERKQLSAAVEDTQAKASRTPSPGSVYDGLPTTPLFLRNQSGFGVNVSSSSTVEPHFNIFSRSSLLMNLSAPTADHLNSSDRHTHRTHEAEDRMPSCPVTSTNTPQEASSLQTQSLANNMKSSQLEFPELESSFSCIAPSALPSKLAPLQQPTTKSTDNSAVAAPKFVQSFQNKPVSPKHDPALTQRLDPVAPFSVQPVSHKTSLRPHRSSGASTDARQHPSHLRTVDKSKVTSQRVTESQKQLTKEPASLVTSASTSAKLSATDRFTPANLQSNNVRHLVDPDLTNTHLPYTERSSLSSYSSQIYTSSASAGPWKYSNLHVLPVHPQVLVPVNASSGSDGESDQVDRRGPETAASLQTNIGEDDIDMILNSQVQGNEKASSQFLTEEEKKLTIQKLSIQKDQRAVKLLVKRAVKFLEAQQKEEEKQKLLRAQLMALSHKMKTSEKFVMLLKAEKEQTEKQVHLVTMKLLQKKDSYEKKAKSIMSLGTKLLGPGYVPRILKPHVVRTSQDSDKQSTTRSQEKLKLMEKEKQIAEKLKKLKEAQAEKATGAQKSVSAKSGSNINSESAWKSKDVIRIDKDLKADISVTPRRRSLLEMNPSTTPNIPLTPRRTTSVSNTEKENSLAEAGEGVRPGDKEAGTDLSSTFRMPSGTLLANFCKIQREKALKYLSHPNSSSASPWSYPSLSGLQTSTTVPKMRLQVSERQHKHSQDSTKSFHNTSLAYSSPLLMFKSYRLNSYFRTKENLSLQSSTYSNKINPNSVLCPYDLQGTCNDDTCLQQHPKDYKFSDHELLEDIVSYCPRLAGAKDGSSPKEVGKCIGTYVDNLLSKHKGKMTIDDLCLWLLSQVKDMSGKRHSHTVSLEQRVWRPQPKEETGLSLDLNQRLGSQKKVEAINMDRRVADKDAVVNAEDMRYFAADLTELLMLEASILEDQTNIELWQKLANKKLYDPNKTPNECLEQALSVLARGLEVNKNDPDLWHTYLTLYRRHSDVKDFPEFCQTALEYAPSYALWFLYLDSLKTFSEKDEVSTQALQFLCNIARVKRTTCAPDVFKTRTTHKVNLPHSQTVVLGAGLEENSISDVTERETNVTVKDEILEKQNDTHESAKRKVKMQESDPSLCAIGDVKDTGGETEQSDAKLISVDSNVASVDPKTLSHQMLEMVLYKTSLNLHTGRVHTAVHFLQMVLKVKRSASLTLSVVEHLTSADHFVLWMVYIHVLEWRQLPQHLYSMANQNPGRLMAKENIILQWSAKAALHNGVDSLVKLHDKASKVWEASQGDEEAAVYYVKLVQSHVSLLASQDRHSEAVEKCRSVLAASQFIDIWLTMADLLASCQDIGAVKQVFSEALSLNRCSAKLHFHQCVFLYQQGDTELALRSLEQFAISHFNIVSENPLYWDPCQLYSQLLKQQESFSLQAAQLKEEVSTNIHNDIYMWLCYSLLQEIKGRTNEAMETFERSLTHALNPDDLILVWQTYVSYLMKSRSAPKGVRETIIRSIISVPTKFPVPFSTHSSAMWVNYYHINRLVDVWLSVLSPLDTLDLMEMCLSFTPSNVQLLLRALDLCLDVKETRRAYSWCKFVAVQGDRPANLAFWKMAIGLAQVEGTPREVEQMMIACVETMPLSVSSWKDFLLFEVSRENLVTVQKLLTYCQQLGLNIEGFVATLSAS